MRHKSFRLEMLQVARLAPKVLGDAAGLVNEFVSSQLTESGGFADRLGRADLYYTVFGLETLLALQKELPQQKTLEYLRSFGSGEGLDFVHLCSLVRCGASLGDHVFSSEQRHVLAEGVERFRTANGGYHGTLGKEFGSAYGALLAWGAYADLSLEMPEPERLLAAVNVLRLDDGGYANEPGLRDGTTTGTAAAVVLCRQLEGRVEDSTGDWLLKQAQPSGGFLATPRAPLPDLLSTATALHALESLQVNYQHIKESCLDFVDTLWSATGGFHGHWADDDLDVEYTSYGLLALGHLSE